MSSKILSGIVTLAVLFLLVASGPANALILEILLPQTEVTQGETTNFIITADSENPSETVDSFSLTLKNNLIEYVCKFRTDGIILEGCNGFTIEKILEEFGYGYGYNNLEKISFNLTLNTGEILAGNYQVYIETLGSPSTEARGTDLRVLENRLGIPYCSIRGARGVLSVDGSEITNNRINFYVSSESAVPGEGFLIGKKGRETFTYRYNFVRVLHNEQDNIQILVTGKFRIGLGEERTENAIITIGDRFVEVEGQTFRAEDLRLTFRKGC